ncbi:MAG TPA: hypothetical protein DCG75_11715 [Bacteroidales bacterium]|nr:hypothetical protein [Bacteroidales bacterium]
MKTLIMQLMRYCRFPEISRFLFQKKRITVLYYHDISNDNFKWQVEYLKAHYNIIDLITLRDFLNGEKQNLPDYSLLITFDDGHIGNYQLLETIKANKIRPVIFLTASIIGTNNAFWFKIPFANNSFKDNLKRIPDNERRAILETGYKQFLTKNIPDALTFEQIQEMAGFVDFQSHTMDHPCLPNSDDTIAEYEISNSKVVIEGLVSKPVYAFAYPNGNYCDRDINLLIKHGYKLAFSAKGGFVNKNTNPHTIPRLSINDTNNLGEFILRTSGIWHLMKKVKIK